MKISNRVFWAGVCITCSAIISGGVVAQGRLAAVRADVVQARQVQITDASNRVVAVIGTRADGSAFMQGLDSEVVRALDQLRGQRDAQASLLSAGGPVNISASGQGGIPVIRTNQPPTKEQVYEFVQQIARASLKAPAGAQFPPFAQVEVNETTPNQAWTVKGNVTSTNSFGAAGQASFTAKLRRIFDGRILLDEFKIQ